MQARGRGGSRPPIGIALDGDLGHRIDAVLAVAMLNGFAAKGESRTIALAISRTSIETAQVADVIAGFYASRPGGGIALTAGSSPGGMIGMPEDLAPDPAPPVAAVMAKTGPEGAPLYASAVHRVLDTSDNAVLIRNMLLAQQDRNAAIVLAGPATGLVRLLDLYGARPQIEAKVARLIVAIGAFPSGAADPAVQADLVAARRLFAEWPTPILAVGAEVGQALPFPAAAIEEGMAWAPAHPVADAYRAFRPMPYDAPASALAATLLAVHPDAGHFGLSDPGTISVSDDGRTTFTVTAGGPHRYATVDPAQAARVIQVYTETVTARPAPRPGRRGGPPPAQQPPQQQQAPARTPPGAKPPVS